MQSTIQTTTISPETRSGDPLFSRALADMTYSERDKFVREQAAPSYREELRQILALGVDEPEED